MKKLWFKKLLRLGPTRRDLLFQLDMGDIVLIPRDMKESRWSIFSWTPTSQVKSFAAEEKLLSHSLSLAGTESSLEKPACEIGLVQISEDRFINTLSIKAKTHTDKNVVILHGYGAGLGFFYRNFAPISKESGFNLYSLDWLGMANSSRPIFPRVKRLDTVEEVVHKTEQFFVESLEDWRKVMKLEKMTLVGHSLGGYLSTAYALKYPEHVEKLILVSPVGVPSLPKNYLMQPKTAFRSLVTSMWSSNITPMSVVRSMGPLGPRLVRSYTSRRFAHLDKAELASLDSYAFHITAQSGSGEYALARLLLPVIDF